MGKSLANTIAICALATVTAMNAMASSSPLTSPVAAAGPLVVSETNPRYFTIAFGRPCQRHG